MKETESYTLRQIKKLYDIEVSSTHYEGFNFEYVIIKVYIDFIPKEITTMTPSECTSYGKFKYNKIKDKIEWEDFIYIRKEEMPILAYTQQEYFLDNFCEELAKEEYENVLREIKTLL